MQDITVGSLFHVPKKHSIQTNNHHTTSTQVIYTKRGIDLLMFSSSLFFSYIDFLYMAKAYSIEEVAKHTAGTDW